MISFCEMRVILQTNSLFVVSPSTSKHRRHFTSLVADSNLKKIVRYKTKIEASCVSYCSAESLEIKQHLYKK
jgi:hypothetical protein